MAQSPFMESNKNMKTVKIRIFNEDYFIKSDGEIEQINQIANYLNEKLNQVKESTKGLSEKKLMILTALNIAGEYFELLSKKKAILDHIEKRAKGIINQIEEVIRP